MSEQKDQGLRGLSNSEREQLREVLMHYRPSRAFGFRLDARSMAELREIIKKQFPPADRAESEGGSDWNC